MAHGTHAAPASEATDASTRSRWAGRLVPVLATVVVCLILIAFVMARPDSRSPKPLSPAPSSGQIEITLPDPTPPSSGTGSDFRASRSKAGAVNAAADYATLMAQLFPLDVARARGAVAEAASDDARDRLVAAIDANLQPLQEQANAIEGTTTYRQAVLATHLVSYSADPPENAGAATQNQAAAGARARVSVWTLLTVSQTPQSPDQNTNAIGSFATVSLSLTWERAWRIDDSTTLDGPAPLIDGTPSTGAKLNSALRGFADWRP